MSVAECQKCGQEKVNTLWEAFEIAVKDATLIERDTAIYGVSCRCTECKRRLDPMDEIAPIDVGDGSEENPYTVEQIRTALGVEEESIEFIEKQTLNYGKLD